MKKAFTLIELIVVIGIISIITAVSVVAIMSARRRGDVKVIAENVKNQILLARSAAVAPSDTVSGATDFVIQYDSTKGKLQTAYVKGDLSAGGSIIGTWNTVLTMPDNMNLVCDVSTNCPYLYFIADDANKLGQIRNAGSSNPNMCVSNKDKTVQYNITINRITGDTVINSSTPDYPTCP